MNLNCLSVLNQVLKSIYYCFISIRRKEWTFHSTRSSLYSLNTKNSHKYSRFGWKIFHALEIRAKKWWRHINCDQKYPLLQKNSSM